MDKFNLFAQLRKYDEKTGYFEAVAASEVIDKAKEIFDYETSKAHFANWSDTIKKATDGRSLGNVREMHGNIAAGRVLSLDFDDANKSIIISGEAVDAGTREKMSKGVLTGVSIGGSYAKKWDDPAYKGCKRYTAVPAEISLVDNPCNPDCHFTVVKADGTGTEMRKFAKQSGGEIQTEDPPAPPAAEGDKKPVPPAAEGDKKPEDKKAEDDKKAAAEEAEKAEKAAVNEIAVILNSGAIAPSAVLGLIKTARAQTLRVELSRPELTNSDLEKLATHYLAVDAREGKVGPELLKLLDAAAAPAATEDLGEENEFADPVNKKYPLKTPEQVRAALAFLTKTQFASIAETDRDAAKGRIVTEWKRKIDKAGPPVAKADATAPADVAVAKGFYEISALADLVNRLWSMQKTVALEQEMEGDTASTLPSRLEGLAIEAGEILCEMAEEETQEEAAKANMGKSELAVAMRKDFSGKARTMLMQLIGAQPTEAQNLHDHVMKLGAKCPQDHALKLGAGALRKATGLADDVAEEAVLKHIEGLVKKAGLYDALPAAPRGVKLAAALTKGQDNAVNGTEVPAEVEELIKKAEKGDVQALMRLTHMRAAIAPPDPARSA